MIILACHPVNIRRKNLEGSIPQTFDFAFLPFACLKQKRHEDGEKDLIFELVNKHECG